jgi:hypothetical protein
LRYPVLYLSAFKDTLNKSVFHENR